MESCLLLVPWIGAQQIIGEHVRRVSVGVRDRKARTAGTVDVLGPRFGAELVVSVRLHWDELSDSCIRGISSIEGYGKRSCSAVKLIRVDGQGSMWVRFVPPVKSAVQQVFLEPSIDDQVFTGTQIRLNLFVDLGQLLPRSLRCADLLLGDQEPKIGKCKLRRKGLLQPDQVIPSVFCGHDFLFGHKQTQERKVEISPSRQRLVKHLIRISRCTPAKLKSIVNRIGIIRQDCAEVGKCLAEISLDQKEVGCLPSDIW